MKNEMKNELKKLIQEAHPADIVALCNYFEKHPQHNKKDEIEISIRILRNCKSCINKIVRR